MAINTTLNTAEAWHPDVTAFVPDNVIPDALVLTTSIRVGNIEGDEPAIRVPWVADDGTAGFVPEGTEIPENNAAYTETVLRTGKVATLGKFSRETLEQPNAASMIVNAMQRAVVSKANAAYLDNVTEPTGLLNTVGVIDGGSVGSNLDTIADAVTAIEADGGSATHIIAAPGAWGDVAKLKAGTGSAQSLVGAGTEAAERKLLGVSVLTTAAMPADTLMVLDASTILSAAGSVNVSRSEDAYFSSDVVAVRVTFRFGWAAMQPNRLVKLTTATA